MENHAEIARASNEANSILNQGLLTGYDSTNPPSKQQLTFFTIFCGIIVAIAPFQFGYKMGELNNPKDAIINCDTPSNKPDFGWSLPKCLPMSEDYFALATSIFALGGLVGSMTAGYLSDRYGRKTTLMFNSLVLFLGTTIQSFATIPAALILGRFISGIGSGVAIVVSPMYLTEIAPIHARGTLNLFNQMSIVFGLLLAQIMGYVFGSGNRWRMVFFVGMALSMINFAAMFFVVESPKHFYHHGRISEAEQSLQKLRGQDDVKRELESWGYIASSINSEQIGESVNPNQPRNSVSDLPNADTGLSTRKINVFSIFGIRKYRQPLFLVFCLQLGQQFSGVNSVVFYSTTIFSDIYSKETSTKLTLIVGAVNAIMTLLAVGIVEKIGRKKLLLSSMTAMFLSMLIFVVALFQKVNAMVVIGLFMVIASFAPGYGPLPFLLSTELFDTRALGAGNSVSIATNWIGTFIVGVSFFALQNAIGYYVFVLYMGFMILFSIIYIIYLPETKNKTFEKVCEEFVL